MRCAEEYGNPCQRFCPAARWVDDGAMGKKQINFELRPLQDVRDIMDPYQVIINCDAGGRRRTGI